MPTMQELYEQHGLPLCFDYADLAGRPIGCERTIVKQLGGISQGGYTFLTGKVDGSREIYVHRRTNVYLVADKATIMQDEKSDLDV